jgi:hypothetical protein
MNIDELAKRLSKEAIRIYYNIVVIDEVNKNTEA